MNRIIMKLLPEIETVEINEKSNLKINHRLIIFRAVKPFFRVDRKPPFQTVLL
jgi:hypothetical protein